MLKREPSDNQVWNRIIYQTGRLSYLPIREPIDEYIVQRVETKKQLQELADKARLQAEKEQLIKDMEKEVVERSKKELENILDELKLQ